VLHAWVLCSALGLRRVHVCPFNLLGMHPRALVDSSYHARVQRVWVQEARLDLVFTSNGLEHFTQAQHSP
jgi:hypothetical protein